jgi:type IV pilus biogenesis protein CpaD/CtpE
MRAHWVSICGVVMAAMSLTACGGGSNYLDPYQKPYTWHPTAAPTANLAAQLANPHDLVSGRGGPEGDAKQSSVAIERIWAGRSPSLSGGSGGGGGESGGGSGGGPSASGGSPGGSGASPGGAN